MWFEQRAPLQHSGVVLLASGANEICLIPAARFSTVARTEEPGGCRSGSLLDASLPASSHKQLPIRIGVLLVHEHWPMHTHTDHPHAPDAPVSFTCRGARCACRGGRGNGPGGRGGRPRAWYACLLACFTLHASSTHAELHVATHACVARTCLTEPKVQLPDLLPDLLRGAGSSGDGADGQDLGLEGPSNGEEGEESIGG